MGLTVRGRDYVYPGGSGGELSNMKNEFTGCGPFLHDDPRDRPVAIYGGRTTIHLGGGSENFVLLPIIPDQAKAKSRRRQSGANQRKESDLRSGIRQVGTTPLSSSDPTGARSPPNRVLHWIAARDLQAEPRHHRRGIAGIRVTPGLNASSSAASVAADGRRSAAFAFSSSHFRLLLPASGTTAGSARQQPGDAELRRRAVFAGGELLDRLDQLLVLLRIAALKARHAAAGVVPAGRLRTQRCRLGSRDPAA